MAMYIRFNPNQYEVECQVHVRESDRVEGWMVMPLAQALGQYKERRQMQPSIALILMISTVDAPEIYIEVIKAQQKKITQALPFLIEDKLIDDISEYEMLVTRRQDSGCLVTYTKRSYLERIRQSLEDYGLSCHWLGAEYHVFSFQAQAKSLLIGDQLLLRDEQGAAHQVPLASALMLAADITPVQTSSLSSPKAIALLSESASGSTDSPAEANKAEHNEPLLATKPVVGSFLRGDFESLMQKRNELLPWRWLASAAAVFFGGFLLLTGVEGWLYKQQADAFEQQQQALYLSYFPGSKARLYKREIKNKLAALEGVDSASGDDFSALMNQVAQPLAQAQSQQSIAIERMSYSADRGRLDINVMAADFNALEQLKTQLQASGIEAQIGASTNVDGKTRAQLNVQLSEGA